MLYYGLLKSNCNRCGKTIVEVYDGGWKTRTQITNDVKSAVREKGGAVTRDNRVYCKNCRIEMKIRTEKNTD